MLEKIAQIIFDKKGFNILALDIQNCSTMTDYFLIAEGNVDKHVASLQRAIVDEMHKEGKTPLKVEGAAVGDWIVIDYGTIIVHLFTPDMREKYALEEVWKEGSIVDLHIDTHQK
jgi:ribosome-associated protein